MTADFMPAAESMVLHALILGASVVVLWFLEIVDRLLFGGRLDRLGIVPRTGIGLRGILFWPLLHGSFKHLLANTGPFLVLGWLVLLMGVPAFAVATAAGWIGAGALVWLFARRRLHVGASGVIFAYLGFLLTRGFAEQSLLVIAIAVIAALLYGGLLRGVLPGGQRRSWEGHLFGLVSGAAAAWWMDEVLVQIGPLLR